MLLLRVSYRVRAHHMAPFEKIFAERVRPLIDLHQLDFRGIWRTLVGDVGEYMELWEFRDMQDYEARWYSLLNDPQLLEIFEITGPMVEGERFTLLVPVE